VCVRVEARLKFKQSYYVFRVNARLKSERFQPLFNIKTTMKQISSSDEVFVTYMTVYAWFHSPVIIAP
jgi:hypothetical protein